MVVAIGMMIILGLYLSAYVLYDLCLVLIHFGIPYRRRSTRSAVTKIKVLVPAHNEELLLSGLLKSILDQDYPRNLIDILVVSDNCTDNTSSIAKHEGVKTIERADSRMIGKGYAIKFGLESIRNEPYDAVVIIDADSVVEMEALKELDHAIQHGARIIQCFNGVVNPGDSWFTHLMDVSRTIGNQILEPAKEKMGLSSHLMGNGMCFVRDVISKYGWDAFTVGEDWEYYAKIVLQGERIVFVNKARVYHRESVNLKQATSQRLRWSSGRFAIAAKYGSRLLLSGVMSGSLRKIDAALPLIFPNPSLGISLTVFCVLFCLLFPFPAYKAFFSSWFAGLAGLQVAFFLVGILYTKNKKRKLVALLFAPIFLVWKSAIDLLSAVGIGRKSWVRTKRQL